MNLTTLAIDLAKVGFPLHGVAECGQGVLQERLARQWWLRRLLANLPPCRVGLEAGGGAHDWAREIQQLGYAVKRIAPPFVKPYRQDHQTDRHDAAALARRSVVLTCASWLSRRSSSRICKRSNSGSRATQRCPINGAAC